MKPDKSNYNKKLKHLTRKLRNDSTPGEIKFWFEVARAKQFYGYQFNRQYPIGDYIVDFICRKLKWIIEIDGYSHQFKSDEDKIRDKYLEQLGYKIL